MRLMTIANPLFWAACGLSFSLAVSPAPAHEPGGEAHGDSITTLSHCERDPAIRSDEQGREWFEAQAHTRDGLPIGFALHLELTLPAAIRGYDEIVCKSITNQLYNLAALSYRNLILAYDYAELPAQGPAMTAHVQGELNRFLASLETNDKRIRVSRIELADVTAPGLSPAHALALFTSGIRYDYPEEPDPARQTALSWDFRQAHYRIAVDFEPRENAWYAMGPDAEGIRRNVLQATQDNILRTMVTREASCLEDDLAYLEAQVFLALREDETLSRFIHLFSLNIEDLAVDMETPPPAQSSANLRPQYPLCISELEKKYGLEEGGPPYAP